MPISTAAHITNNLKFRIGSVKQKSSMRKSLEINGLFGKVFPSATLCSGALVSFWCSVASADILLEGAIYCDSGSALSEMVRLAHAGDNQGLAKVIATEHVTSKDLRVKVLARGGEHDSALEIMFPDSPTTYWTLSRWVTSEAKEAPPASPSPSPSSTPAPPSPKSVAKAPRQKATPPFDDQGGEIIWHRVDGKWKWLPRDPHNYHFKGRPRQGE